jgi:hypothetical protein
MEAAAIAIFKDFPEAFVLFGGATLVLYHDSVRHSADLDLLSRTSQMPSREEIITSIEKELTPLGQAMGIEVLQFALDKSNSQEERIYVTKTENQRLFRVDLTNLGSAIESEIENHPIAAEAGISAVIRSATKELLLLQKAEAFLLRRNVKARDAYDVHVLRQLGAALSANLQGHLEDTMLANEIDANTILDRIERIEVNHCRLELKPILPAKTYQPWL